MNSTAYDRAYRLLAQVAPHILLSTVRGQYHTLHLPALCHIPLRLMRINHRPSTNSLRRDRRRLRMLTNPVAVPLTSNHQVMVPPVYRRAGSKHLPPSFVFFLSVLCLRSFAPLVFHVVLCRKSVLVFLITGIFSFSMNDSLHHGFMYIVIHPHNYPPFVSADACTLRERV